MTTRPGYIWSGSEWVSIGQEAVVAPVSYQASAPSTPSTGDIWIDSNDDVPGIDTSQFLRWRKTAVGGETSVSGTDDNGLTLQYTANYEQVYLNGVLLVRGQDYTATNGTSITGLTALAANDVVEVFGVVARVVGDVYTQAQADAKYSPVTTTGLVLISSTDFSAATSASINGVFTSSYRNYLIKINLDSVSVSGYQNMRLRVSGSDNTTSNYYGSAIYNTSTTATPTGELFSAVGYFKTSYLESTTTDSQIIINMDNPQLAKKTIYSLQHSRNAAGPSVNYTGTGTFNATTQFDGFTLYPESGGTITGTIKVYGYK